MRERARKRTSEIASKKVKEIERAREIKRARERARESERDREGAIESVSERE